MNTKSKSSRSEASCISRGIPSSDTGAFEDGSADDSGGIDILEAKGADVEGMREASGRHSASSTS